jgi:hypothetical protein
MEATYSSETLLTSYDTTRRHILQDINLDDDSALG